MPNDFQYVKLPDGSYGKFNAGVSDDAIRQTIVKHFPDAYSDIPAGAVVVDQKPWERYANIAKGAQVGGYSDLPDGATVVSSPTHPDSGPWEKYAAAQPGSEAEAFAHPPVAPPVAGMSVLGRPAMPGVSSRYAGPQSVALPPIQRASRDQPMEMAKTVAPMAMTMPFVGGPVLDAIATRSVEPMLPLARTLVKSYAGSKLGGYIGGEFGETGRTIGRIAGGALGSISPDSLLEKAPFGIGKMFSDAPAEIPDPVAQAVRNRTAAWLPTRLAPRETSPSPFEGMQSTSPEGVSGIPKIAPQEPQGPAGGPLGRITSTGPGAKIEMKGAELTPTKSLIQQPGSAPPNVKVTLQSYPRQQLVDMIRDPSVPYGTRMMALNELRRSPAGIDLSSIPGAKYLMEGR